jgi:hypothetical protein
MKQWARQVEQLQIHCSVCQHVAQRILRNEPLLYGEKAHLEHDVSAALDAYRGRVRDGIEMRHPPHVQAREISDLTATPGAAVCHAITTGLRRS